MTASSAWRVWWIAGALSLFTLFGLLAALLGTGLWHWAAWISLAVPVAIGMRALWRQK